MVQSQLWTSSDLFQLAIVAAVVVVVVIVVDSRVLTNQSQIDAVSTKKYLVGSRRALIGYFFLLLFLL